MGHLGARRGEGGGGCVVDDGQASWQHRVEEFDQRRRAAPAHSSGQQRAKRSSGRAEGSEMHEEKQQADGRSQGGRSARAVEAAA